MKNKHKIAVEKTKAGYMASTVYATAVVFVENSDLEVLKAEVISQLCEQFKREVTWDEVVLYYDIPAFFEIHKEITAKGVAARIGMNHTQLSQYMNGIKTPSQKQKQRIQEGINQLGRELVEVGIV